MVDSSWIVESALADVFPDEVDVLTTSLVHEIVEGRQPTVLDMKGATRVDVVTIINTVAAASQLGRAAVALYLRENERRQMAASEAADVLRQQKELHEALGKVDGQELLALLSAIQRRVHE